MEDTVKSSYLGSKYLLDNLKKQKVQILRGQFLKGYGITIYEKGTITKTYYDTPDCFFNQVGITININKRKEGGELVVRFNSGVNRIMFLTNIPDTFSIKINPKSRISDYIKFITSAIYELIPNGISADVEALLKTIQPIMIVEKKRERFRAINANGFKTIMSFSYSTYANQLNKKRSKVEVLEFQSDSGNHEFWPTFNKLVKFEFPALIETQSSDLNLGIDLTAK